MPAALAICPYMPADHAACLHIFRSNQPKYFTADEELDFIRWLDGLNGTQPPEDGDGEVYYFVAQKGQRVLACGGWGIRTGAHHATLIWGMVDSVHHGNGIGTAITQHRLEHFRALHPGMDMTIDTSHHTAPFYERFGFVTETFTKDGYEPGLHCHDMQLRAAASTPV